MKYLKTLILAVFLILVGLKLPLGQQTNETDQSWREIVEFAREYFPQEGQLRVKSDGFVYLKVDDRYIHSLFSKLGLAKKGFTEPPYFRTKDSPGAHISVFYADENIFPVEIGHTFHFELKKIAIVHTRNGSYAVLQVDAPELEKLREKYRLKGKIHGHGYHISLAKKTGSKS